MAEARNPSSIPSQRSQNNDKSNELGDFECNICFELAQDPVITLCGHLYCWPCLYRWLRLYSQSHECPVCKAVIEEDKLIPLYGRGRTPSDPRSKPVPSVDIPHRPAGQRPETAPPPPPPPQSSEDRNFSDLVFGLMGGFIPFASASFGSFGMSAGFGGLFSPFFIQFNGFPGLYTPTRYSNGYNNGSGRGRRRSTNQVGEEDDENLKKILFIVLFFVLIVFLTV